MSVPTWNPDSTKAVWRRFASIADAVVEDKGEIQLEFRTIASEHVWDCWSCELKYIPQPNRAHAADVGMTFYIVSACSPEEALRQVLDEFEAARTQTSRTAVAGAHADLPTWRDLNPVAS